MAVVYKCIIRCGGYSYYLCMNRTNSAECLVVRHSSSKSTKGQPEMNIASIRAKDGKITYFTEAPRKVAECIERYAKD